VAALSKTGGIIARQLAHGQTNFARMIWKFGKVYNADRRTLYVHATPAGRRS
jgi:hopanoid C-3 methylase